MAEKRLLTPFSVPQSPRPRRRVGLIRLFVHWVGRRAATGYCCALFSALLGIGGCISRNIGQSPLDGTSFLAYVLIFFSVTFAVTGSVAASTGFSDSHRDHAAAALTLCLAIGFGVFAIFWSIHSSNPLGSFH
jgi:hypothetical protein